ncbi:unnamed protein product [Urochloa humidicola]
MAVQAQQHLAHAFHHHDSLAISRPRLDNATTATSAFLVGEPGCGHPLAAVAQQHHHHQVAGTTVFSDPRSELTCNGNNNNNLHDGVCFAPPRKRARTGGDVACAGLTTMEGHRALLPVPAPHGFAPAEDAQLQSSRVLCSAGASTSGRSTPAASRGVLSHIHRHGVEIDAFVRMQNERLRAGLEEARRRHVRAAVSAVERAAARRLRAAEADLERALARGAELGERLRQVGAEEQAWRGVATGHEAAAAGLRATLDQLLLQPPPPTTRAEGQGDAEADDAGSCCFGPPGREEVAGGGGEKASGRSRACRSCGGAEACVLVLPCRHLCLCAVCEGGVEACPVCAAAKNASLHVLLS